MIKLPFPLQKVLNTLEIWQDDSTCQFPFSWTEFIMIQLSDTLQWDAS